MAIFPLPLTLTLTITDTNPTTNAATPPARITINAPNPPPEYSPSVYSQQQQYRLSHYLPSPDTVDPSSPRASKAQQQQQHASHFVENRTDLSMRADLEGGLGEKKKKKKKKGSVFRMYAPVKAGQVERGYWKRGCVVLGILGVVVVLVVVVVVAVWGGLRGKRS